MALAFSPLSFEVLGYWQATRLPALTAGPDYLELTAPLEPAPQYPSGPTCEAYVLRPPSCYGPQGEGWWNSPDDRINLHNGWYIEVQQFRDYNGNCDGRDLSAEHLYGRGLLRSDAIQRAWPVDLIDVSVDPESGEHLDGRIVVSLGPGDGTALQMNVRFRQLEFWPSGASAEVLFELPDHLHFSPGQPENRSNKALGICANVTPDFSFDPIQIATPGACAGSPATWSVVDENLPWRLSSNQALVLGPSGITWQGGACTQDRLGYAAVPVPTGPGQLPLPDNNLSYLRPTYTSANARVTATGLQGDFQTNETISYATSLPAAVGVRAEGASLTIADSQIQSGELASSTLSLRFYRQGTDISYMSETSKELRVGHRGELGGEAGELRMVPADGKIEVHAGGLLRCSVASTPANLAWAGAYSVPLGNPGVQVSFYAAAAAFSSSGAEIGWTRQTTAPAPAENAWRQLAPAPVPGAEWDPGVNVHLDGGAAQCGCFDPGTFHDADLDLYVRRGGVSENYRLNAGSYGEVRDKNGYLMAIREYNLLFVDNALDDPSDIQLDLRLPYPSDVIIKLAMTADTIGCPANGVVTDTGTLLHKYWRFEQTVHSAYFVPIEKTSFDQQQPDPAKLPKGMLTLVGTAKINGLGVKTTDLQKTDDPADVEVLSQWMPDGDYADIKPYPEGASGTNLPDYFRVSGVPYALRDVKLSRYHSLLGDPSSLPDTLDLPLGDTMGALPRELLDADGKLTPQSLQHCADTQETGCGFVLVDGNGAVDYFGEIEKAEDGQAPPAADAAQGQWPVATNSRSGRAQQATAQKPKLTWAYPIVDEYLDLPIPVKFLANSAGGALAGVWRDLALLPGAEVLKTDVALVASFRLEENTGFEGDIGIFLGYTASQAAFRALAMNRPKDDAPGVKPFTNWSDVEGDIEKWAEKFEYSRSSGDKDDPVDLAQQLWISWTNKSYIDTYDVLEPTVRALKGKEAYGITGLQSGSVLDEAGATLSTGLGQVVLVISGGDFRLDSVKFGVMVDVQSGKKGDSSASSKDKLLHVDWLTLQINRDGEILIEADNASTSLTGDYKITADIILLIGTKEGFERIEGGITIENLDLSQVKFKNLGAVFGAGRYAFQPLFYLGLKGEGDFSGYKVGGALLFGLINPESVVLKKAGFAHLLAKIGGDSTKSSSPAPKGTFAGIYAAVYGDFPIYGKSCIAEVKASAELRGWYFTPTAGGTPIFGGYLRGSVYGTALCLVNARGELTLIIEQLRRDGTSDVGRTCNAEKCTAFSGEFWAALGLGFCEPDTWTPWSKRWWNDDLCYNMGLQALVSYIDPPDAKGDWDASFDIAAE